MQVYEALVLAKGHLRRFFWHRHHRLPGGDGGLITMLVGLIPGVLQEGYRWGVRNVVGIAVRWSHHGGGHLDIFLAEEPRLGFADLLARLFPEVPVRLVVTGHFQFANSHGLGSEIALEGRPGGKIGLFLIDTAGTCYALTCAHVLDAEAANQNVTSGTDQIGTLAFRKQFIKGQLNPDAPDPVDPNRVDCALAKLTAVSAANVIPVSGAAVAEMGSLSVGQDVGIVRTTGLKWGEVESTSADLWFPYDDGRVYFDDLTLVTGDHGITPGDSGSLAISTDGKAAGLTIGFSLFGRTTDNPPVALGSIGILCDMGKIGEVLTEMVGSALTLP